MMSRSQVLDLADLRFGVKGAYSPPPSSGGMTISSSPWRWLRYPPPPSKRRRPRNMAMTRWVWRYHMRRAMERSWAVMRMLCPV